MGGIMSIDRGVNVFIGIAVLFAVIAALYPTTAAQGDALNASGFPLGNLFVGGGVVFIIIAAVVLKTIMKGAGGR